MNFTTNKKYALHKGNFWIKFHIDPIFFLIVLLLLIYSMLIVWSASGQNYNIIIKKFFQIIIGLIFMIGIAQYPPRIYETWSPHLYFLCIVFLCFVDFYGSYTNGAKRWINFGIISFQPSEIAKLSVPLLISRSLNRSSYPPILTQLCMTFLLIFIPTLLIVMQPDLGTAILVVFSGLFIILISGITWKTISFIFFLIFTSVPVFWYCVLQNYQKNRIITFLYPKHDPLGSGYHITQSKIAIGSGGLYGKGWFNGSQSQLDFLPERCTDFIFSVLAEEFGFLGVLILLILYLLLIIRGLIIAIRIKNSFGRFTTSALIFIFFIYIFVNISMVSGILPVVGIPLPLISYGGSSLIILMSGFGIIMSIYTHKKLLSNNI